MGQSKMDNPEKLATYTRQTKQKLNTIGHHDMNVFGTD
jgi:hypothetical protein